MLLSFPASTYCCSSIAIRGDFLLVQIVEPTVDTTHEDFHYVLEQTKGVLTREDKSGLTYISKTERKVFSLSTLNFFLLIAIVIDDIEIGNLLVPIIQITDAIVIV